MRAQTPSYAVSTKVPLPESIAKRLEKSLRISNSAYNEALSFGLKRFEALKRNSQYQELLEARRPVVAELAALKKAKKKDKALSKQVKDYNGALFELRKAYGLTESELQKHLARQRRKPGSPYQQFNSGDYLQIVCQGFPPSKVSKGEGVVGIDPGISTVAFVSPSEVALVDLVPKNITQKESCFY